MDLLTVAGAESHHLSEGASTRQAAGSLRNPFRVLADGHHFGRLIEQHSPVGHRPALVFVPSDRTVLVEDDEFLSPVTAE